MDPLGSRHVRGWSLEIGVAFHGSVVRRDRSRQPTTWIASINSTALGEFAASMVLVLHDWELYQAAKGKR